MTIVNIDQSGANHAGLKQMNRDHHTRIKIRQSKYLNSIIEQDHHRIKRLTRPMLGFKKFSRGSTNVSRDRSGGDDQERADENTSGRQVIFG